jgi:hypothetical protein
MIIKENTRAFQPHPEGTFRAVVVDVTEPQMRTTRFGQQESFKIVFETEHKRNDGTHSCVWSRPLTASAHEKSNLRKLLRQMLGRDLSAEERRDGFDLESLIGMPVVLTIAHEESEGVVYANLLAALPDRNPNPYKPCGKFIREKNRPPKDASYSRTPAPAEKPQFNGWEAVTVHVGANRGRQLGELNEAQLQALHDKWVPSVGEGASPEDLALKAALEECFDNIPF